MSIAVVVESEERLALLVELGSRLAQARQQRLFVFGVTEHWEDDGALRKAIGEGVGECEVVAFDPQRPGALLEPLIEHQVETVVLIRDSGKRAEALRSRVLQRASCEVLTLRPGPAGCSTERILVPMARGPHARSALRIAASLAGEEGRVISMYVEPDVGLEAESVGRRVLRRLTEAALGDAAKRVERRTVIGRNIAAAIVAEAKRAEATMILVGASKSTAIGQKLHGTIGLRVHDSAAESTVGLVRGPAPLTGRLRSLLEGLILRGVPQLDREHRLSLFERVQSNSYWDFDFVSMTSMSTAIAAIGLVQDSEPVVIGAMLVAPLMVPILGLGLALVHGNPVLGWSATRTVILGFVNAFVIGLLVGWLASPTTSTEAMVARNWPGVLDLVVAFIAGFAGAYANSRASLSAAVTGVAIAAALVPPIATSGLAVAVGDWSLASGASLLFFTNMVAIAFGASLCLWVVGLRGLKPRSRANRISAYAITAAVLSLGVWFATVSPGSIPEAFRTAVRAAVGDSYRVVSIEDAGVVEGGRIVVVRLAGPAQPNEVLVDRLIEAGRPHCDDTARIRVVWSWERLSGR